MIPSIKQQTLADTPPNKLPRFQPLTGIYEPSAIQQLADGRFLVVEDEKTHPFSLVTIKLDGSVSSTPLSTDVEGDDGFRKLDDLEGLALDRAGNIYAITSHSRDDEGDKKKSRNKLVRFRVEGERIVEPRVVKGLKPTLLAAHPVLAAAAKIRDVKDEGGLNIEALEISPDQQRLLIGFRSPLLGQRAIIASVENPAAMFEADAPPQISPTLITLDLGGNGIRGMAHVPALNGYLVIGGPESSEDVQFQLWFWSGHPDAPARRVSVPGLPGFEHAEGVSPAVIDGQPRIVIVSDDGSRKDGRFAHFLLLDPEQLQRP
jgi:hypothetical protein